MIPGARHIIEETLQNRHRYLPNSCSWERETGRGVQHEFGLYRLTITTQSGHQEEVVIQEDCSSIATRVWDCAVLTAKWVENRCLQQRDGFASSSLSSSSPSSSFPSIDLAQALCLNCDTRDRPVYALELGSGMGLLSISLAKMGAAVLSTEYGAAVGHLQRNCIRNNVAIATTRQWDGPSMMQGRVYCRELDWYASIETVQDLLPRPRGGEEEGSSTNTFSQKFDLIVVTDCSLTRKDARGVLDMIHRYGTSGHTTAIVGICLEREGTPYFIDSAKAEFPRVDIVPSARNEYHKDYQSTRHSILLIRV
jgi:hypothetical protein